MDCCTGCGLKGNYDICTKGLCSYLDENWLYQHQLRETEALRQLVIKLRDSLNWYVEEDDTNEGGHWDEENAYWIEGKRRAEKLIEEVELISPKPLKEVEDD